MGWFRYGVLLFACMGFGGPAAADDAPRFCGHDIQTVVDAAAYVSDHNLKSIIRTDELLAYDDPGERRIWIFTRSGHEAHPTVVCRALVPDQDGKYTLKTSVKCGAGKSACDRLVAAFVKLDQKTQESITSQKLSPPSGN